MSAMEAPCHDPIMRQDPIMSQDPIDTHSFVPPILAHARELPSKYPVVFCDIWGVIHDGQRPRELAIACLKKWRDDGIKVVLISNVPRPHTVVPAQFDRIGVDHGCYDAMVTSGDATRDVIAQRADAGRAVRVHHIGPERDQPLFEGLACRFVAADEAEIVVCTGLVNDDVETPADYEDTLQAIAKRGTDFVCANPDLVVQDGERLIYCAGALAARFAELGGRVIAPGKPHSPIYESCVREAGGLLGRPVERREILAIGDGMKTDVAGAGAFGIDCLFIATGIHTEQFIARGEVNKDAVREAFGSHAHPPVAVMRELDY